MLLDVDVCPNMLISINKEFAADCSVHLSFEHWLTGKQSTSDKIIFVVHRPQPL